MATIYNGFKSPNGEWVVMRNRTRFSPAQSQRLRNHSPDGFAWGYGGSGPAQLALALVYDVCKRKRQTLALYQAFKWDVVAKWPQNGSWQITAAEIRDWATVQAWKQDCLDDQLQTQVADLLQEADQADATKDAILLSGLDHEEGEGVEL